VSFVSGGTALFTGLARLPIKVLQGKKLADSFLSALLASLLMQAGAAGFIAGRWSAGYELVAAGSAILIWRLKAAGILSQERLQKFAITMLIVAFFGETFTLYIFSRRGGSGVGLSTPEQAAGVSSGRYRGVVLWTEAKPTAVLAPLVPALKTGLRSKQIWDIPFDGVYWFFKFPDRQPPKDSYTIHGSPSATVFRSSDNISLQMEARQNFTSLLDMSCCTRIGVGILNADRSPGSISIELTLTNLRLPGEPSQSLGRLPVTSKPQGAAEADVQPVPEMLSFPMPISPTIRQFDAATVRFIRDGKHRVSSAKIAIERFTLVPRGI
jgi:hypothetical protein